MEVLFDDASANVEEVIHARTEEVPLLEDILPPLGLFVRCENKSIQCELDLLVRVGDAGRVGAERRVGAVIRDVDQLCAAGYHPKQMDDGLSVGVELGLVGEVFLYEHVGRFVDGRDEGDGARKMRREFCVKK